MCVPRGSGEPAQLLHPRAGTFCGEQHGDHPNLSIELVLPLLVYTCPSCVLSNNLSLLCVCVHTCVRVLLPLLILSQAPQGG